MSGTHVPVRVVARWASSALLAVLCGCTSLACRAAPAHADPSEHRAARRSRHRLPSGHGAVTGDVIQTTDGYAVIDFDRGNVVDRAPTPAWRSARSGCSSRDVRAHRGRRHHGGGQVTTDELVASVGHPLRRAARRPVPSNGAGSAAVIVRDGHVRCSGRDRHVAGGGRCELRPPRRGLDCSAPPPIDAATETRWAEEVETQAAETRGPAPGPALQFPLGPRPRTPLPPPPRSGGDRPG